MIVFAPKVRFGTKWPSMTSRWIRSAPGRLGPAGPRRPRFDEVGVEDAGRDPRPARRPRLTPPPRPGPARGCARRAGRPRSRRRAARDAGRRPAAGGSPARSAASWPQAAPISWPRLRRIVVVDAGRRASVAAKRSMTGIGLAVHGVWATGFIGIRLTWAWSPRSRSAIAVGVGVGVVDAADHRDLVADPPAGRRGVIAGGGDDLGDRPAPVERDEHVAQRVARRVERDGQRELRPERGQPPDAGHDARRRHRDVPRAQPEPARGR